MKINSPGPLIPSTGSAGPNQRARTPEDAAKQFEEVLVREFVKSMTKDLFKSGLQGEDGPAWVEGYGDTQRDVLNDALTQQLVDRNTLGLAEMLTRRWGIKTETPTAE